MTSTTQDTTSTTTTITAPAPAPITAPDRDEALAAISTATIGTISARPDAAAARFSVTGVASDRVATTLQARGHTLTVDEPAQFGGDDSAANPVEYALGALIACQVVTYRFWAARLGIRLDDVQITAHGDLDVRGFFGVDDDVRPGFGGVELDVRLTGPEPAHRYAELHDAVDRHCPVLDLFANSTPVQSRLVVGGR